MGCHNIKSYCKPARRCRERAQTALPMPSHGIIAKALQQGARCEKEVERTLPGTAVTLLRCS